MRSAVFFTFVLASQLAAAAIAGAQTAAPAVTPTLGGTPVAPPYPAISATATATRDFVPDIARVALSVDATASTAVGALAAMRAKEQAARAAVAPAAIVVSAQAMQYDRGSVKTGGSQVMVTETLATQVEIARAGTVVDALRRLGPLLTIAFDTTHREQLYRDALADATSTAYARAVVIASAAKVEIDRITFVDAGAGAEGLAAQNSLLERMQGGGFPAALFGQGEASTIHATAIVTVRLR